MTSVLLTETDLKAFCMWIVPAKTVPFFLCHLTSFLGHPVEKKSTNYCVDLFHREGMTDSVGFVEWNKMLLHLFSYIIAWLHQDILVPRQEFKLDKRTNITDISTHKRWLCAFFLSDKRKFEPPDGNSEEIFCTLSQVLSGPSGTVDIAGVGGWLNIFLLCLFLQKQVYKAGLGTCYLQSR